MVRGPTLRAGTGRMPRSNQRRAVLGWTPFCRAQSLSFTLATYHCVRPFATQGLLKLSSCGPCGSEHAPTPIAAAEPASRDEAQDGDENGGPDERHDDLSEEIGHHHTKTARQPGAE